MKVFKFFSLATLMVISLNLSAQSIIVEAEDGILQGTSINTTGVGFSGRGFVDGLDSTGNKISVVFPNTLKQKYDIVIRYRCDYKSQDVYVNNKFYANVVFNPTTEFVNLPVFAVNFHGGGDTLSILKNWGWTDIDVVTATPSKTQVHDYTKVVPNLIDLKASDVTKKLYAFLRSYYGKNILSGQTNDYTPKVIEIAGHKPIINAFDMQNYSINNPWGDGAKQWKSWDDGTVQSAIKWYNETNKKGIVTFAWHWFSPSGGKLGTSTFATNQTTFDVSRAVVKGNEEYDAIIRDIDTIAFQLKRLQLAGVPILWRPMHESGGGWFWWGAKGPDATKKLWDILYDRLTNFHGLHNLIWVWSTPEANWYPGDEKVDIIGYDSYPGPYVYGVQQKIFDDLYTIVEGKKIVAMTENGAIPDIDECFNVDVPWAYFVTWSAEILTQNSNEHIVQVYNHPKVITLESDFKLYSNKK